MWNTLPLFGSVVLFAVMVAASYTFAVSLSAGRSGSMRTLASARLGAYGTVALIVTAVLCLAYAFVSHDFRLRYVSHYSDRSMPLTYLLTSLWGGQDGSLLWWMFLLSMYIGVCVKWLGKRYVELQPYVIATLMVVVIFFCVLMAFAANPFSTSVSGARPDGDGLNPLLQNFYMIIHPPSLYVGFVGCTVPFAFAVAALVTGRLDAEWMQASRKWTLFAWLFLSIGNTLGMLWAYEELGWGGYWAWDPVENAAFMPWLTATAYVHSVMIQERRGIFKVWNVGLICLTFFMTIFGTFLTRSGAIASVHSFAQSSIGEYFVWFLVFVAVFTFTITLYRWPELRNIEPSTELRWAAIATGWSILTLLVFSYYVASKVGGQAIDATAARDVMGPEGLASYNLKRTLIKVLVFAVLAGGAVYAGVELVFRRITKGVHTKSRQPQLESLFSREVTFMLNNLGLLSFLFFVLIATTFPMVSEALWKEKVSVGPPFYNAFVQPIAMSIFAVMGTGTLFGWKKTSAAALKKNFIFPGSVFVGAIVLHFLIGSSIGYPAVVWGDPLYNSALGKALQAFNAYTPVMGVSLVAFNAAVVVQEFSLLFKSRSKSGADKTPAALWYMGFFPGLIHTLFTLPHTGRRRYGGYIVHLGIIIMFLGFTGHSWNKDSEATLSPHQVMQVDDRLSIEYVGPRMEVDTGKRMIFADVRVMEHGKYRDQLSPAKFIYKKMPESPTTEVAMMHSIRDDLYLVVGQMNPETKTASLQIHVNSLVGFIWFGAIILGLGSILSMWPELQPEESRVWRVARGTAAVGASITLGIILALLPTPAFAQGSSSHAGVVHIENAAERDIFSQLRCMCGDCPRNLLSTCACSDADSMREKIRAKINAGEARDKILADYAAEYGSDALSVPPNSGAMRAIYMVPLAGILGGTVGLGYLATRWKAKKTGSSDGDKTKKKRDEKDAYDARLDEELRDLDDDG
jgi:cytochrome c-type biogenesis protein CcmF